MARRLRIWHCCCCCCGLGSIPGPRTSACLWAWNPSIKFSLFVFPHTHTGIQGSSLNRGADRHWWAESPPPGLAGAAIPSGTCGRQGWLPNGGQGAASPQSLRDPRLHRPRPRKRLRPSRYPTVLKAAFTRECRPWRLQESRG